MHTGCKSDLGIKLQTSQEAQVQTWMDNKTDSGSTSSSTSTFTAETAKPIVEKLAALAPNAKPEDAKAIYNNL
jgi:hypothetical protein